MHAGDTKVLQDMQCKLSKPHKVGSINYASSITNTKWKLSQVKLLNTKALHCHLDNLKMSGDSTQDMILLHSNVTLLVYVGTDGIVELPNFDNIDESFDYKHFLVPQSTEPEHQLCKRHYDYFAMLIAS